MKRDAIMSQGRVVYHLRACPSCQENPRSFRRGEQRNVKCCNEKCAGKPETGWQPRAGRAAYVWNGWKF